MTLWTLPRRHAALLTVLTTLCTTAHAVPAQAPPSFAALHDRFVAAVGGREALAAHASLHMRGTLTLEGMTGSIDIWRDRVGRFRQRTQLEGVGEVQQGFDGRHGWTIQPSGPALLDGDLEAGVRRQADWYGDITAPPEALRAVVEAASFEGEPSWRATYVSAEGPEVAMHFSQATGRKVGYRTTTPAGESTSVLGEYKPFDGVLLPTKLINRIPQGEVFITITTVEWDRVPPETFALPPAIRALIGGGTPPERDPH